MSLIQSIQTCFKHSIEVDREVDGIRIEVSTFIPFSSTWHKTMPIKQRAMCNSLKLRTRVLMCSGRDADNIQSRSDSLPSRDTYIHMQLPRVGSK